MSDEMLLSDLLTWSLQIVALTAVAAAFPVVARLRTPPAKLLFWQSVLLACLALPLLHPLQREVAAVSANVVSSGVRMPISHTPHSGPLFTVGEIVLWGLALGTGIRLALIGVGFLRLGRYRRGSKPLEPASTWGVEAELLVSDEIGSPVTFGVLKPVVLLPANFAGLSEGARDAVLCHEILHVRRKDWLFTLAEEIVRAVFWFHPGIWWTLGEIQLAREQTVDRAAIEMTRSRDRYVDALLTIAGAAAGLDVAPAPLFLRKRHLKQRVVSILKEVRMSQKRTVSTLAAGFALLAASCWLITDTLPLQGAPQAVVDGEGVSVDTGGAQLMHRPAVYYPLEATARGIEGTVVAQVKTDASGNVVDASILSGPDELRKSVLQSVLSWHYAKNSAQSTQQVTIGFTLPKDSAARAAAPLAVRRVMTNGVPPPPPPPSPQAVTVKAIRVNGLSDEARDELLKNLPVHVGDLVGPENLGSVAAAAREFDEHLQVSLSASPDATLAIRTPDAQMIGEAQPAKPGQIRVGAQVEQANLLQQVSPAYPPLAKAARVQGTVTFEATIGKDGSVENLNLLSGPPLLVQSALEAVQQWKYKPTLLNGQPVEVLTTVNVNYTLSQ